MEIDESIHELRGGLDVDVLARRDVVGGREVVRQLLGCVGRIGHRTRVDQLAVRRDWVGKSLRELELPRQYRISVIAVHDYLTDEFRPVPDPDAPLKDSDALLVAGEDERLKVLLRRAAEE